MNLTIREYNENDLISMMELWNEVVEDGIAFPQMEPLTLEEAKEFFRCCTMGDGNRRLIHPSP